MKNVTIFKDEMGVVNYYNLDKQLVMQEYQTINDLITLYYHDKKITKIKANNLVLDLDMAGNILHATFNNGVAAYFASKHERIIFLDHDGEYLGFLKMAVPTVESSSWLYVIVKIINKLNETMPILIKNKYQNLMANVQKDIKTVNDEMILDTISILQDDNRHSVDKILKDYRLEEKRAKEFLALRKSKLSKEKYQQKHEEITKKYAIKRSRLKMRYGYMKERKELEEKQDELMMKQYELNKLLLAKKDLYDEYLTR